MISCTEKEVPVTYTDEDVQSSEWKCMLPKVPLLLHYNSYTSLQNVLCKQAHVTQICTSKFYVAPTFRPLLENCHRLDLDTCVRRLVTKNCEFEGRQ